MIRQARKAQGKTIKDIAEMTGHSIPYISNIETGEKEGSIGALATIAEAVGLKLVLVGIGEDMSVDDKTEIPPAGNQTIGELAKRLCSRLTDPFKEWSEADEKAARDVLYAVYLAGYQQGALRKD